MREAVATVLAQTPDPVLGHPQWGKENLTNYANKSVMCVCVCACTSGCTDQNLYIFIEKRPSFFKNWALKHHFI